MKYELTEEQKKAQAEYRRDKEAKLKTVTEILKSHDIEMDIWGCGCCDSPVVSMTYKGKKIIDREGHFEIGDNDF